jgi:hypothetical protein
VAAGDVGAHGHGHEQGEGVRHRRRDQASGGRSAAAGQLACARGAPRKSVTQSDLTTRWFVHVTQSDTDKQVKNVHVFLLSYA